MLDISSSVKNTIESASNSVDLLDLYKIHQNKLLNGYLSIHPERWLRQYFVYLFLNAALEKQLAIVQVGASIARYHHEISKIFSPKREFHKQGYYFASPSIAGKYLSFIPCSHDIEHALMNLLELEYNDILFEQSTPVGRIDCLRDNEIIEFKAAAFWKSGLGQLLAYSTYYPTHIKTLHLFGKQHWHKKLKEAAKICRAYNVQLRFQEVNSKHYKGAINL